MIRSRKKKHQKYNNTKTEYDGIMFDSKKELRMYVVLKRWREEGRIEGLELQKTYELQPRFVINKNGNIRVNRPITYTPDFVFFDKEQNRVRVLDAKGMKTDTYLLKKKLFEWKFRKEGLYLENVLERR